MKRSVRVAIFFILLVVFSCHKKEETTFPSAFPAWLQLKITELVPGQQLCEITDVTIIEYNGKIYYHVYCGIWSCMYCQLFDEQGNRPVWDSKAWEDFFANKKVIRTVPACQ